METDLIILALVCIAAAFIATFLVIESKKMEKRIKDDLSNFDKLSDGDYHLDH